MITRDAPLGREAAPRRSGFTLIELLMVVLIIGILATIMISKFGASKDRAYVSAMKADLHNFASTAESRYAMDGSYANVAVPRGSPGVTVTAVVGVTDWSATATHVGMPGKTCVMSFGGNGSSDPLCQ